MAELTPMMQQYMEIKSQYQDCILFYRLGDFYEMFYEDALTASKELEITLTGKNCGQEDKAPMCGVPHHAVESYLSKLIQKGYRVAICEQIEEAKATRGIVRREVIRVVTPGTNLNTQSLDETKNNYLMSIYYTGESTGISVVDVTTGDFYLTEVDSDRKIIDEIQKYIPSEIICNHELRKSSLENEIQNRFHLSLTILEDKYFCYKSSKALTKHFKKSLTALGISEYKMGIEASEALMQYLYETQKNTLHHLIYIKAYQNGKYMVLDSTTRRNLELTETLREKQKRGSLLWVIDKTKTAMGARLLRSFFEQPLLEEAPIQERLDAVEEFIQHGITREEIREYLNSIYDLERLMSKISFKTAGPRDLLAFAASLEMLPHISLLLKEFQSKMLQNIYQNLDTLEDLKHLIVSAIDPEAPLGIKDGGIIKFGFHTETDSFKLAKTEGKKWLADLEVREREATGIKNLRVKYNRVFGYYLEVTNSYQTMVPDTWIRKQTLANAERYTTAELKELEDKILNAEERLSALEYEIYCEVREQINGQVKRIQQTAKAVASTDVFSSLAVVADKNHYVRPSLNKEGRVEVTSGRHPVVECMISNDMFVPNDTHLDKNEKRISIITGPNMAGKSTYMRQTALIVFLAQIGSFVPADEADIGIVDRIFTRVGASDDLASGQSTFMVEMTEVANILTNATKDSLLILDEIGRGTSTFDGLAIAWAVVEFIASTKLLGAKALFATHYHELTELEGKLDSVNNYCIAVKEQGEDIIFLRKIVKGGADKSYGIQVAKLAGVPDVVLKRAREIVEVLSDNDIGSKAKASLIELHEQATDYARKEASRSPKKSNKKLDNDQFSLFGTADCVDVMNELRNVDLSVLTPLDALNYLYKVQVQLRERI